MTIMGQLFWKLLAAMLLLAGLVGVVLPVFPTLPFLVLAAAAAARGWPWLDERLNAHATYGPMIRQWRDRQAVPRAVKWFSTLSMALAIAMTWLTPSPTWLRVATPAVVVLLAWWLWRRPDA